MSVVAEPFVGERARKSDSIHAAWSIRQGLAYAAIATVFVANLLYLAIDCPLDLATDEAYYWDWSRRLDLSYYSKGPLVAYLIRASCSVFGDTPLGVRFPALLLAAGTGLLTFHLTRRLFGSDRIALVATLLNYATPIAVSRGVIMTIDSPLYFFWALATTLAHVAIAERKNWIWALVGLSVGFGLLAKFSMAIWFVGLFVFLIRDPQSRKHVHGSSILIALIVAAFCTLPMLVWSHRHGWLTLQHVGENIGISSTGFFSLHFVADFWLGQLGVIGPLLFPLILISTCIGLRRTYPETHDHASDDLAVRFLLCFGLPFFLLVLAASFRTNPGANWALPAYFTLNILFAFVIDRILSQLSRSARLWKPALGVGLCINLSLIILAYFSEQLYAPYKTVAPRFGLPAEAIKIDPTARVRGWAELGQNASHHLQSMGKDAFILADSYEKAAALAFYAEGQPITYNAGPYYTDPEHRRGLSQYDVWDDRDLSRPELRGRDVLYVGEAHAELKSAFSRVEPLPDVVIERQGLRVRSFKLWRCTDFQGMTRPVAGVRFWSKAD